MNSARITFLGLFDEFDVKEKSSLKMRVWEHSGATCDVLGVLLERLGHTYAGYGTTDPRLAGILEVPDYKIKSIYEEIDRKTSTNDSIRNLVKRIFTEYPCREIAQGY